MLRFLMYAEGYGQFAMAREHFQALPRRNAAVRWAILRELPDSVPQRSASREPPAAGAGVVCLSQSGVKGRPPLCERYRRRRVMQSRNPLSEDTAYVRAIRR